MNDRPIDEIAQIIFNMSERKEKPKSDFSYERNAAARRKIEAMREEQELESKSLFFSDASRARTLTKKQREAIDRTKALYDFGSGKSK